MHSPFRAGSPMQSPRPSANKSVCHCRSGPHVGSLVHVWHAQDTLKQTEFCAVDAWSALLHHLVTAHHFSFLPKCSFYFFDVLISVFQWRRAAAKVCVFFSSHSFFFFFKSHCFPLVWDNNSLWKLLGPFACFCMDFFPSLWFAQRKECYVFQAKGRMSAHILKPVCTLDQPNGIIHTRFTRMEEFQTLPSVHVLFFTAIWCSR